MRYQSWLSLGPLLGAWSLAACSGEPTQPGVANGREPRATVAAGSAVAVASNSWMRSLWMYDPAVNNWVLRANLPTARYGVAAAKVSINGLPRMEVVGGLRPGNNLQYVP